MFEKILFITVLLVFSIQTTWASNIARELRMANEIVDSIIDGDAEILKADGHEFLSIYTEADDAKGAVIIMHGRGFHPDWVDTIQPLRIGLVDFGWNTLSIQMPVLQKDCFKFSKTIRIVCVINFTCC